MILIKIANFLDIGCIKLWKYSIPYVIMNWYPWNQAPGGGCGTSPTLVKCLSVCSYFLLDECMF